MILGSKFFLITAFLISAVTLDFTTAGAVGPQAGVTPLKIINDYKQPEEVLQYYCSRDAAGFVWAGMLEMERKAFTLWENTPMQDSFYVAKKYGIKTLSKTEKVAQIEVTYDLLSMSDVHGTRVPVKEPRLKVVFELKNVGGSWKIAQPIPQTLSPVVMEQFFAGLFEPGGLGSVRGLAHH